MTPPGTILAIIKAVCSPPISFSAIPVQIAPNTGHHSHVPQLLHPN